MARNIKKRLFEGHSSLHSKLYHASYSGILLQFSSFSKLEATKDTAGNFKGRMFESYIYLNSKLCHAAYCGILLGGAKPFMRQELQDSCHPLSAKEKSLFSSSLRTSAQEVFGHSQSRS